MAATMVPLPSFIRASAWDAANASMRKGGRQRWSRADYNAAARTQERLVRACYARPSDSDDQLCFVRFSIAEAMERAGRFTIGTDFGAVNHEIDAVLAQ